MDEDPRRLRRWLEAAGRQADGAALARVLDSLSPGERMTFDEDWRTWAHGGQREPEGEWRVWTIRAGRTFGKTRAGAEWVLARARETPEARIALVAATMDEAIKVMIHGDSGLIASARTGEELRWIASQKVLVFPSGARAFAYSAHCPDKLRGPQHHFAWCDELAKWARGDEAWDNLMLGLRLGTRPRTVVTTTPRPIPLVKRIETLERSEVTRGRSRENGHVAEDYHLAVAGMYGGTRLGRQELDGELIEDLEGTLFPRAMLEGSRGAAPPRESLGRVVVGVDPPASAEGVCGIVVCGLGPGGIGYVFADASAEGLSPEGWARAVAATAQAWGADRVIAEANNGGKMIETVLRAADANLPLKLTHASDGKVRRAEPVAALFEAGRAKLADNFPALEDQLAGLLIGGDYAGPGRSPDRADAMVWAMTELMLTKKRRQPRVRVL